MATPQHLRVKLPDYHELAEYCGVDLCVGPNETDCSSNSQAHRRGFVRYNGKPTVHWRVDSIYVDRERIPTRRSIYRFCKFAYRAKNPQSLYMPKWKRIYEEARYARMVAAHFRFRLYREILEDDRSKVRFHLRDPQDRKGPLEEKAWRWAEKRG